MLQRNNKAALKKNFVFLPIFSLSTQIASEQTTYKNSNGKCANKKHVQIINVKQI